MTLGPAALRRRRSDQSGREFFPKPTDPPGACPKINPPQTRALARAPLPARAGASALACPEKIPGFRTGSRRSRTLRLRGDDRRPCFRRVRFGRRRFPATLRSRWHRCILAEDRGRRAHRREPSGASTAQSRCGLPGDDDAGNDPTTPDRKSFHSLVVLAAGTPLHASNRFRSGDTAIGRGGLRPRSNRDRRKIPAGEIRPRARRARSSARGPTLSLCVGHEAASGGLKTPMEVRERIAQPAAPGHADRDKARPPHREPVGRRQR